jgi:hypothetical protein
VILPAEFFAACPVRSDATIKYYVVYHMYCLNIVSLVLYCTINTAIIVAYFDEGLYSGDLSWLILSFSAFLLSFSCKDLVVYPSHILCM